MGVEDYCLHFNNDTVGSNSEVILKKIEFVHKEGTENHRKTLILQNLEIKRADILVKFKFFDKVNMVGCVILIPPETFFVNFCNSSLEIKDCCWKRESQRQDVIGSTNFHLFPHPRSLKTLTVRGQRKFRDRGLAERIVDDFLYSIFAFLFGLPLAVTSFCNVADTQANLLKIESLEFFNILLPNIIKLCLADCHWRNSAIEQLSIAFSSNKFLNLLEFELCRCPEICNDVQFLNSLSECTSLRKLTMYDCNVNRDIRLTNFMLSEQISPLVFFLRRSRP